MRALLITTLLLAASTTHAQLTPDELMEDVYRARAHNVPAPLAPLDLRGIEGQDATDLQRIDEWLQGSTRDDGARAVLRGLTELAAAALRSSNRLRYCAVLRDIREAARRYGIRPHAADDTRSYVHHGTERPRGAARDRAVLRIPRTCK